MRVWSVRATQVKTGLKRTVAVRMVCMVVASSRGARDFRSRSRAHRWVLSMCAVNFCWEIRERAYRTNKYTYSHMHLIIKWARNFTQTSRLTFRTMSEYYLLKACVSCDQNTLSYTRFAIRLCVIFLRLCQPRAMLTHARVDWVLIGAYINVSRKSQHTHCTLTHSFDLITYTNCIHISHHTPAISHQCSGERFDQLMYPDIAQL